MEYLVLFYPSKGLSIFERQ